MTFKTVVARSFSGVGFPIIVPTGWLTKQELNREITFSKNAFEITEEIRAIQSNQGIRDFPSVET